MPTRVYERTTGFHRPLNHRLENHEFSLKLDLALSNATHIQQVIEQTRQLMHLPLEHRAQGTVIRIASGSSPQHFGDVPYRSQRITQFMAEHR